MSNTIVIILVAIGVLVLAVGSYHPQAALYPSAARTRLDLESTSTTRN